MTTTIQSTGIAFLFLFCINISIAQKPVADSGFEIKLASDNKSFIKDNLRISESTGYPIAIYKPEFFVSETTPEEMGREYLSENRTLLGLTDKDVTNLKLHAIRENPAGTTIRFRQHYKDLAVNESEITITISPKREVCFVMNSFSYGVDLENINPNLSETEARQSIFDYIAIAGNIIEESNSLQIFHYQNETRLVYRVVIASEQPLGEWEAFVDAHNGDILKLEDISCYYHDHHEAILPGLPLQFSIFLVAGSGNVYDPDPLSSATADYDDPGFDDNGDVNTPETDAELMSKTLLDITFSGGNYQLIGPYAEIQDFESPFYGLFGQSSSDWNNNRNDNAFEAVNTYFHVDASMRYINDTLGLTIMPTNYTTGVRFDPHGLNGADNSHYLGGSQRISFGEGGVDDAEDSDVIHHELGHGLHDWVTNGGLSQVQGLSEGSGDYWAASYNRFLDYWDPTDAPYNWVFNWDGHNEWWNGRVVNYPNSYPSGLTGGIHTQGQIWSTCMMRVWDAIGREETDLIFWSGLGMTNSSSSQDDAANAVYTAAVNLEYTYNQLASIHDEMTTTGYTLPDLPLPVELTSFTANKEEKTVKLQWRTASETNNAFYTIERSTDGQHFDELGKVAAKDGSSSAMQSYEFLDFDPNKGMNYYRLKQTDTDATFSYSDIVSLRFEEELILSIYPNPVVNSLYINGDFTIDELSIFDVTGTLHEVTGVANGKAYELQVGHLPTGVYTLKAQVNGAVKVQKFYKK